MSPDWTEYMPSKTDAFERYPKLEKKGKPEVEFVDDGKRILTNAGTSVLFHVRIEDAIYELWLSMKHPMLRTLIVNLPLAGKKATLSFTGEGRQTLGEVLHIG